jgi:mxaJ protein
MTAGLWAGPVLRVCADPNNLPFSNARAEGFENKIAALVSDTLHEKISYVWWAERGQLVKDTLNAGQCDVLLGVPEGLGDVLTTKPYYRSTYVFVYRKDSGLHVRSLNDPALEKLRIGIHVLGAGYAPPAAVLARRGIRSNVTGYSMFGPHGEPNPPAKLVDAVERREVDIAIVWGPLGGFFAKREPEPLEVVPVSPDHDGPVPFCYSMAMAVRKSDTALRDRLNEALAARSAEIESILKSYGVIRLPF